MPSEDPHPSPLEELDTDQTLFFKRRQDRFTRMPRVVVWTLAVGSGVLALWALAQPARPPAEEIAGSPSQPSRAAAPGAAASPPVADPARPMPPGGPASGPPPPAADASAPLNLDVNDPGNARVRDEVLRRIDLMPGVSAANKDKLYASVDHARRMGRVLTIPFFKGETAVRPADVDRLRHQLDSPSIRSMADDPTVVFVVLGYADARGNGKVNADLSLGRARNVLEALRDRCGLQNVMHAVAMGGSTLFSTQQADKNRVVEVWAVLP